MTLNTTTTDKISDDAFLSECHQFITTTKKAMDDVKQANKSPDLIEKAHRVVDDRSINKWNHAQRLFAVAVFSDFTPGKYNLHEFDEITAPQSLDDLTDRLATQVLTVTCYEALADAREGDSQYLTNAHAELTTRYGEVLSVHGSVAPSDGEIEETILELGTLAFRDDVAVDDFYAVYQHILEYRRGDEKYAPVTDNPTLRCTGEAGSLPQMGILLDRFEEHEEQLLPTALSSEAFNPDAAIGSPDGPTIARTQGPAGIVSQMAVLPLLATATSTSATA
ncbi:hypothetical protein RYH80_18180 [Halobaculum sp. MBLA0147]|uniref:hypothetical protein n=1 Tax=Halobaculum sp. MBLA0147 TaxID=3079934 RepID=UPI003524CCF1